MIGDMFSALTDASASGWWVILIGVLVGVSCSLIGTFLVLRKMAMLGDAISHAVLPGIVVAFLWTESRNIVPMLLGAGALGLLTAFLTDVLNRQGKLQSDAAIGVTFTWLFAIGVILVSRYASQVDLDLDCVLYGEILYAPFDRFTVDNFDLGPRAVWMMGMVASLNFVFVAAGWKELKVTSFDPGLAVSLGINVVFWHYALMAYVSMTTVAAFESVGAILVVAMLVVPPNTAYLLTDRLSTMVLLACAFGAASAVFGYALATALDSSIAGAMATVSGVFFALAALFGPRHGVVARQLGRRAISEP